MTQERHRNHLINCVDHLNKFIDRTDSDVVLMTQQLHYSARALGKLTGAVTTEELLDVIFKEFCIGK